MYDLIISGGRVIDPSQDIDAILDVAVSSGRITALQKDLPAAEAKWTIDAEGKIVTPGLIDLHTHVYEGVSHYGVNADVHCLQKGVTTCLDVGSAGSDTFAGLEQYVINRCRTRVLALLNLSAIGMITQRAGELENSAYADMAYAVDTVRQHRDTIVGLKVRMEKEIVGRNGAIVLDRVREAAEAAGCPIMFHIGDTHPPLATVLATARKGDIVTHMYHSRPEGILDAKGDLIPEVIEAAQEGVLFDVGHGQGSFSFEVCRAALDQGFEPHTISSDIHAHSVHGPAFDLVTTLSKFLFLGLPFDAIVKKCTHNPAKILGRASDLGTLRPGSCADITILELRSGKTELTDAGWDKPKVTVTADRYLTAVGTIRAGEVVF